MHHPQLRVLFVESYEIFLQLARKKISLPSTAAHDACRCVARTVHAAGCWTVPLSNRKFRLVLLICGPSEGNPAGSPIQFRYSWSRSRSWWWNVSSSCPWNSLRRVFHFWCESGMLVSTSTAAHCSRLYCFAQNSPPVAFFWTPKSDT
jgi:hypothetical protein